MIVNVICLPYMPRTDEAAPAETAENGEETAP